MFEANIFFDKDSKVGLKLPGQIIDTTGTVDVTFWSEAGRVLTGATVDSLQDSWALCDTDNGKDNMLSTLNNLQGRLFTAFLSLKVSEFKGKRTCQVNVDDLELMPEDDAEPSS